MKVWRVSKRRHAVTAFSGEGARLVAGRWNAAGFPMVYTSSSLSLAALEVFVHLDAEDEPDLVSIEAEISLDEADAEAQKPKLLSVLPPDWRRVSHPALRLMGQEWVALGRSLAMMVPSAVIDGEWNVLLNPAHPDASRIKRAEPKPFQFDSRMFRARH